MSNTTQQVFRVRVEGMRCRSCEALLTTQFRRLEGVKAVHADSAEGVLSLHVDTALVTADHIVNTIVEAGFVPGEPFVLDAGAVVDQPIEFPVKVDEAAAVEAEQLRVQADDVVAAQQPATPVPAATQAPVSADAPIEHREASFAVVGMTCASCVAVIEKSLSKVDGVLKANVNLATEKLTVSYDAAKLTPEGIIAAVKQAGYQAAPLNEVAGLSGGGHILLSLTGMTCASCSAIIEK